MREVKDAADAGADYVTMSPIFPTQSKPGYGPALGLDGLRESAEAATVPVIALAGVDAGNAGDCLRAGSAGVAVMGEVMRGNDPGATVSALLDALASAQAGLGGRARPVQP